MSMPLDYLSSFPLTTPRPGEISLAVVRHMTEDWSIEATAPYHKHRAQLIHQFVDDTGVRVASWGQTDAKHPTEVVELVVALGGAGIGAIATLLAAWISRPRKATAEAETDRPAPPQYSDALLPGFAVKRSNGDELRFSYIDGRSPNMSETIRIMTTFLNSAVDATATRD